jgi:hypothetical protein
MTLYEKIIALYPQLTDQDFVKLIVLQNDGDEKGDYLASWNHTLPKPTQEQLQ